MNIKIGKKSVNPPEISLANRMQYIRDAVRDPAELKKFENMYARLRHMTSFVRLFPLTKHPGWERVCHERNATIAKLRFFSEVLYRCDVPAMFMEHKAARATHMRALAQQTKAAKAVTAQPCRPLTHENLMRRSALDHFQLVVQSGDLISIGGIAEGEARPALMKLCDALGCEAQSNPPGLERDVEDAEVPVADIGFRQRFFCRIIHSKPANMKTARMALAAGEKLKGSAMAVTIHDDVGDLASPCVSHDPKLHNGNAIAILDDLELLSSETLISGLHSWEQTLPLEYTLRDVVVSIGPEQLRAAMTYLVGKGFAMDGRHVDVPEEHSAVCRELVRMGYMALGPGHRRVGKSHDDISVCATPLAVSQLSCFVSLSAPKPMNSLRPDLALADRTNFELILLLSEQEWQWRPLPAKKEDRLALEYKHNQPRLWYTQSETPHKLYMVALLSAADIFAKGIVAIPHYSAAPAVEYRRLLQGQELLRDMPALGVCFSYPTSIPKHTHTNIDKTKTNTLRR